MHNSAMINLQAADFAAHARPVRSSILLRHACTLHTTRRIPANPKCAEETAYPAAPDSEYGWEKLFSERLYFAFARNLGLDVRVARFHNIFGPRNLAGRLKRRRRQR